jgi:PKD repeat protein
VTFTVGTGVADPEHPPNPVKSVRIEFGDGDFEDLGALTGPTSVSHIYSDDGTFTVKVTVTDTAGQQVSQSLVLVVLPEAPISVTLTYSPPTPAMNQTVTFTVMLSSGGVPPDSFYDWDFGDHTTLTTTSNSAMHGYKTKDAFTAKVTVHTSDGKTGIATAVVSVH